MKKNTSYPTEIKIIIGYIMNNFTSANQTYVSNQTYAIKLMNIKVKDIQMK